MEEYKIKKGDKFLCINDYIMDNGSIAYVKGKEYLSENDGQITDEEFDAYRRMIGEPKFFEYFQRIEKPCSAGLINDLEERLVNLFLEKGETRTGKVLQAKKMALISCKSTLEFIRELTREYSIETPPKLFIDLKSTEKTLIEEIEPFN